MAQKLVHLGPDGYIDATATAPDNSLSSYRGGNWYPVDASTDLADAVGRPFDVRTRTLGEKRQETVRIVPLREFLQRFTIAERVAFNEIRKANPVAEVLWSELVAGGFVRLDDHALIDGMALVKAANAANGFLIWPDNATADARIAAIRA
jgi:hypothetical protein